MKKISLLFYLLCFTMVSFAQQNVVKLGLTPLASRKLSLNYERVLSEKSSIQIDFAFKIPGKIPNFFFDGAYDNSTIIDNKVRGLFIRPEFRIYPGSKGSPNGFYLGPYLQYSSWNYEFGELDGTITRTLDGKITSIGLGLQLGVQWIIADHFSIDFSFFSIGVNRNNVNFKYTSDDVTEDLENLKNDLEFDTGDWPIIGNKLDIEVGNNFVEANAPFWFPGMRLLMLRLGYAF